MTVQPESDASQYPHLARALELPLVLASASPRRAALLEQAGIAFEVCVPDVPEEADRQALSPAEVALAHARAKALAVVETMPGRLVLGADTVVVRAGQVLGKPRDASDARLMLTRLSGGEHEVITGVVIALGDGRDAHVLAQHAEHTRVVFRDLSECEIDWYIATGEPFDKAGAYGIQGRGALLVRRIEGCYFNVVGLPLSRTCEMLAQLAAGGADGTVGGPILGGGR